MHSLQPAHSLAGVAPRRLRRSNSQTKASVRFLDRHDNSWCSPVAGPVACFSPTGQSVWRVPLAYAGRNIASGTGSYKNLERRFRTQVEKDRPDLIDLVKQRSGVYLPCKEPETQVDYIIVCTEPSFGWADSNEDADWSSRTRSNSRGFEQNPIPAAKSPRPPCGLGRSPSLCHGVGRSRPLRTGPRPCP